MEVNRFQKLGGICAIVLGFIYIVAFVIYGAVLEFPDSNAIATEKLKFLSDNYHILFITNFISYVLFGMLLAVLVVSTHQRIKDYFPNFSQLTSVFGIIWVGLVIASGMISNIGLDSVVALGSTEPENAMSIWTSISIVSEGLGGGNEIVGGIWVLLLSFLGSKKQIFSKPVNIQGYIVGLAGVLTVIPVDIFKEIFGLSQIIWFISIGIFLMRKPIKNI